MLTTSVLALLFGIGTVYAAEGSPFGKLYGFDKVSLNVEGYKVPDNGVLIDGQLYIPVNPLYARDKLAYYYDPKSYEAFLFFGGNNTSGTWQSNIGKGMKSKSEIAEEIMQGIPYESEGYHAGLMRQDVVNIASLAKGLLLTSDQMENAVQQKLSLGRTPNMELVRQAVLYRSLPLEIMEDRMEALADELKKQIGSRQRRMMEDVIENIDDALRYKQKSLNALEDWMRTSDKDDLEDYRDYEDDVKKHIYEAIELLTGEDLKVPGKVNSKNIKTEIEKWILKQGK